jgi:hypothetical protein
MTIGRLCSDERGATAGNTAHRRITLGDPRRPQFFAGNETAMYKPHQYHDCHRHHPTATSVLI